MTCSICGRTLPPSPVLDEWAHVPGDDARLDRRRPDGSLLQRRFVCAAVTPDRIDHSCPVVSEAHCYSPAGHVLYAGTNRTGWALVSDR